MDSLTPEIILEYKPNKTKIVNLSEIADFLHRHPKLITTWFNIFLGQISTKEEEYIYGKFKIELIQQILMKFIEGFVECPKCESLETDIVIKKKNIQCLCHTCNYEGDFRNNNKTKLDTFIVNNPHLIH